MNLISRAIALAFNVGWLVALATGGLLVWDKSRALEVNTSRVVASFDLSLSGPTEQAVATIVLAALALPGLILLAYGLRGSVPERRRATVTELDSRVGALEQRFDKAPAVVAESAPVRPSDAAAAANRPVSRRWRLIPRAHD